MAQSADEQRRKNRERMARTRQNKAAITHSAQTLPQEEDDLGLIEVVVPPEPPKASLKDRLFGDTLKTSQPVPPTPVKRSSKKEDNLIATVLPTVIATFIATYSQQILPDPYKPCAPSQQECSSLFSPLMAIIARHVIVPGKANQDVIDLTNSLLAGIGFGVRSYVTYVQITNREVRASLEKETSRTAPTRKRERTNKHIEEESVRASRPSEERIEPVIEPIADSRNDVPNSDDGPEGDGGQEARAIAMLLARDRRGRSELKLV